jgi:hypothetical protein
VLEGYDFLKYNAQVTQVKNSTVYLDQLFGFKFKSTVGDALYETESVPQDIQGQFSYDDDTYALSFNLDEIFKTLGDD